MGNKITKLFEKSASHAPKALVTAPLSFLKFDLDNPGDMENEVSLRDYQSVDYVAEVTLKFDKKTGTYSPDSTYTDAMTPDTKITPPELDQYAPEVKISLLVCNNGQTHLSWESAEQISEKLKDSQRTARRRLEDIVRANTTAANSMSNTARRILTDAITLPVKSADGKKEMNLTIRDYKKVAMVSKAADGEGARIQMDDGNIFETSMSVEDVNEALDYAQGEALSKNMTFEQNVSSLTRTPLTQMQEQPQYRKPQVDVAVMDR